MSWRGQNRWSRGDEGGAGVDWGAGEVEGVKWGTVGMQGHRKGRKYKGESRREQMQSGMFFKL